jgi:hypothetical protein
MIYGFFPVPEVISIHHLESLVIDDIASVGQPCVRVGNVRLGRLKRNILTTLDRYPPYSFQRENGILYECLVGQVFRDSPGRIWFFVSMGRGGLEDHVLLYVTRNRVENLRFPASRPFLFPEGTKEWEYLLEGSLETDGACPCDSFRDKGCLSHFLLLNFDKRQTLLSNPPLRITRLTAAAALKPTLSLKISFLPTQPRCGWILPHLPLHEVHHCAEQ